MLSCCCAPAVGDASGAPREEEVDDALEEADRWTSLRALDSLWAESFDGERHYNLDSFELGRTIGLGRYARVRLAKIRGNRSLPICIKILKKRDQQRLDQIQHTLAEKETLFSVSHPFLIQLLYTFQDQARLYMVLELSNGGELWALLRKKKRFAPIHANFYNTEVVSAISYLHSLLVVYRDIKPENILIHRTGHIKLTDFGFAKYLKNGRTYTFCGTPTYMAPEVILGRGHGLAVDWWAVGILMFEMLAGQVPFDDRTTEADAVRGDDAVFAAIVRGHPRFPPAWTTYQQTVYKHPRNYITKLLVVDPRQRMVCKEADEGDFSHMHVRDHQLFHEVSWDDVAEGKLEPPFRPNTNNSDFDASCFPEYEESDGGLLDDEEDGGAFVDWGERSSFAEEARQRAEALVRKREEELAERMAEQERVAQRHREELRVEYERAAVEDQERKKKEAEEAERLEGATVLPCGKVLINSKEQRGVVKVDRSVFANGLGLRGLLNGAARVVALRAAEKVNAQKAMERLSINSTTPSSRAAT